MIITASNGATWDIIATQAGLDEFSCDSIMSMYENSYAYSDVLTFEGGEQITVDASQAVESKTLAAPWE